MDLILHLGAHRTGSTALIRCFGKNVGKLTAAGAVIRPPEALRAVPDFSPVPDLARRAAGGDVTAGERLSAVRDRLAADVRAVARAGARRLVLSDENMIGTMLPSLKARLLYPDAALRLAAYAAVLPQPPALVAIAVRTLATWWPSVYGYVLPRHPLTPFGALTDALADSGRGWTDVVADLRGVFPGIPVLIWRQESFAQDMTRVVAALAGLPGPEGLERVAARIKEAHLRKQGDRIHELRRSDPALAGPELEARLAMMGDAKGRSLGFRPPQRAALDALYQTDLDALRAQPGVTLI